MGKHFVHRVWCYLAAVVILSVVVTVHEGGHWMAAELCGAHCKTFNLGFGPGIKVGQVSETEVWIRCIPFGGSVELPMSEPYGNSGIAISELSTLQKLFVFGAGIGLNFISGVAVLLYLARLTRAAPLKEIAYEMAVKGALVRAKEESKFKIEWAEMLGIKVHRTLRWLLNFFAASANPFISLSEGPMIGWRGIVKEVGVFSVAIAIVNLIPIAPLDGARMFDAVMFGGVLSGGRPAESMTTTEYVTILTGVAFLIIPVILGLLPAVIVMFRFEEAFFRHLSALKIIFKQIDEVGLD